METKTRFLTVRQWCSEHSWPPKGGLRHLIFNANKNGLGQAIKKVGKRVLIDEAAFFSWVGNQRKEVQNDR